MTNIVNILGVANGDHHHTEKKRATQFGSFYLRVGAIAFGVGNMVYSGLELGQYFELQSGENAGCNNVITIFRVFHFSF